MNLSRNVILIFAFYCCFWQQVIGQTISTDTLKTYQLLSDTIPSEPSILANKNLIGRKFLAGGLSVTALGSSLLFLAKSNNYNFQKEFNIVNDSKTWLQLDKNEHSFLSYTTSRYLFGLGTWAGVSPKNAVIVSSTGSLLYLSTKEFLDGHNAIPNTGWSWSDMGANMVGIGLFALQELAWQEQKIQLKFSALPKKYEPLINARANIIFGHTAAERILKDHNAQTYWLSFNLKALGGNQNLPNWLNLAVGYGGTNMYGPYENIGYYNGVITFDRTDLKRYRQWYFSPDIDFTKIRTNSRAVKTLLFALNTIKVPFPALEYSNNQLKGHWLHF